MAAKVKTKVFYLKKTQKTTEISSFLDALRPDSIRDVSTLSIGDRDSYAVLITYDEGEPKLIAHSPSDGMSGVGLNTDVYVTFDESVGGATNAHLAIYKDGAPVPNPAITVDGAHLQISDAVTASGSYFQVLTRKELPFSSGRTLGKDHVFSFKT